MYTVCPKCALTLVVTAADLRVAQGFVRCGRCSNVFNALARLSEDRNAVAEGTASATLSQPSPPLPPEEIAPPAPEPPAPQAMQEEEDSIPETALEFNPAATDVSKVFVEQAPDPQWSAATGKFKALIRKTQNAGAAGAGASGSAGARAGATTAKTDGAPRPIPSQATPAPTPPRQHATPAQAPSPQSARQPVSSQPRADSQAMPVSPVPPSTPQHSPSAAAHVPPTQPSDTESQFDIEVDAAFLAATAQLKPLLTTVVQSNPPADIETPDLPVRPRPESKVVAAPRSTSTRPGLPSASAPGPASAHASAHAHAPAHAHAHAPARAPAHGSAPLPASADIVGIDGANVVASTHPTPLGALERESVDERSPLAHLWSAGTGALAILLAAQIVHHYRHDLAANEQLYKPLTAVYSALGIPLVPRWSLTAYDVRQLGAAADNANAGQITVRASVKNTAKQAQPLPLLRVTLQDRFGNRIAARDVPPQSYLPRAIPPSSFLSAGQRIDAEMAFVDPGSNAVGFEIDACLPAPGGSIACANDGSAR